MVYGYDLFQVTDSRLLELHFCFRLYFDNLDKTQINMMMTEVLSNVACFESPFILGIN